MIENIDNVLLKDILAEFLPDCKYSITEGAATIPQSSIRVILPIEGENIDLDLLISEDNALLLGELISKEKPTAIDESITMTALVILKKLGEVLTYFSEYTFGEPILVEDIAVEERTYHTIEISKDKLKLSFLISEPSSLSSHQTVPDSSEEEVDALSFQSFSSGVSPEKDKWSVVLDIPVEIIVELGKTQMTVQDILNLQPGSVVELDKLSGESVDVLANGRHFATGEVVVIGDNFGVRLTNINENIYENTKKKAA